MLAPNISFTSSFFHDKVWQVFAHLPISHPISVCSVSVWIDLSELRTLYTVVHVFNTNDLSTVEGPSEGGADNIVH